MAENGTLATEKIDRRPTQTESDKAVWDLAFQIEERLKKRGIHVREEYEQGKDGKPDTRSYFLVQSHGPFTTRGDALSFALTTLVDLRGR